MADKDPLDVDKTALDVVADQRDPADYDWVPVFRRPRSDGWTPNRQRDFIAALADDGRVSYAARQVGMSENSCHRLRRSPGGENFANAWEVARRHASQRLIDIAFDRVIDGTDEPVFDRQGNRIGRRMRQNDRLHMFLLRAYHPERFRYAHQEVRRGNEPPPPALPTLEEAMGLLTPAPPEPPHQLMAPDELSDALDVADALNGELPSWHRGRADYDPATTARERERCDAASAGPDVGDENE